MDGIIAILDIVARYLVIIVRFFGTFVAVVLGFGYLGYKFIQVFLLFFLLFWVS